MTQDYLERLNYFNGQRLEAVDLRLEQEYHITVRRILNRSLYAPGIAAGLEVMGKSGDPHTVIVAPGVALDEQGRELILLQPRELIVVGIPSEVEGTVYGNYLVIEYAEAPVARVEDGCAVRMGGCGADALVWGGPTRLRSDPRLRWQDTWPRAGSGQIVLAQAELDKDCKMRRLNLGVRKYVSMAEAVRTMAYALEGEKDIDSVNPKDLYFHIRGNNPESAVLYLRGALFSTLYYSELGAHNHAASVSITSVTRDLNHSHSIAGGETDPSGEHKHGLNMDEDNKGVDNDESGTVSMQPIEPAGTHTHTFAGLTTDQVGGTWQHTHPATATVANSGAPDRSAHTGNSLRFINNLRVLYDNANTDITDQILAQLRDRDGAGTWATLGNGQNNHDLVTKGTGEIDLVRLGLDLSPGEHRIRLSVPSGGGKILYNLYVE